MVHRFEQLAFSIAFVCINKVGQVQSLKRLKFNMSGQKAKFVMPTMDIW